ncbi:hypothetical protein PMAYCL1PPCAC_00770, partial [Pristionchus mayeri]
VHDRVVRVLDTVTGRETLVCRRELIVLLRVDIVPVDLDELIPVHSEVLMDDAQCVHDFVHHHALILPALEREIDGVHGRDTTDVRKTATRGAVDLDEV